MADWASPAHAVDRPQLIRRLDQLLDRPLSLVVGPAGSGKTVLLAQWSASHPETSMLWISLERTDDDPVRLARKLLGGLAPTNPEVLGAGTQVSLTGEGVGRPFVETLAGLLGDFPQTVIILDDLHHLSNAALLSDLGALVELLPPHVHLVLSSRADAPMAWSRHRLRHDVLELRQADLAFDEVQAAELVRRISGKKLSEDGVSALVQRTEGWAAGLQLAALTLRSQDDPEAAIAEFSGQDRLIADYLSGEVLEAQPERVRDFLLHVSVVDELCAELATELSRDPGAQLHLEELERQSMFLVPLDSRRQWYRFHHLFRDLLRFRLRAVDPLAEPRLLIRAAAWHVHRGDVGPAVEYLLRAEDWDGALELVLAHGREMFERGEMATVNRWLTALPSSFRDPRLEIRLHLGTVQMSEGLAAAARDTLNRVTGAPGAPAGVRAAAQAILASLVQWEHDPAASVDRAERALAALANTEPDDIPALFGFLDASALTTMVTGSGGRAHFLSGNHAEGRRWLAQALATDGAWYSVWRVHALGSLGLLEAWSGDLDRAEVFSDQALGLARDAGHLAHPATGDAFLAQALVALERGQPALAGPPLFEGRRRAEGNRRGQLLWIAVLARAELDAAGGHWDEAEAGLREAESTLGVAPPPIVAERALALRARGHRLAERPLEARRVLGDSLATSAPVAFERAAAALALGDPRLAVKAAAAAADLAAPDEPRLAVQSLLLSAWIAHAEDDRTLSHSQMVEALTLAERHGLVECVAGAGPTVVGLVSRLADRSAFAAAVVARARDLGGPSAGPALVDPLTSRELEVLAHLPTRMTNAELAAACYVSVNTVKTHVAHIYRKLGVTNRSEAVDRARVLGLL